jgi:predicted transcriptional regulator
LSSDRNRTISEAFALEGMRAYMKRTTVHVDDDVEARIRQEAARRGMTVSDWVREAVSAHLPGGLPDAHHRRTFRAAGAGASGRSDISVRIDELLASMLDAGESRNEVRVDGKG